MNLPVDAHVHFHRLALVAPTLDAAASNFQRVAGTRSEGLVGVLLLCQMRNETVFETLAEVGEVSGWRFCRAIDERETLIASRGRLKIVVVCGRQLRAADGLEVLALGTIEEFPDGLSFADALACVQRSGALAVLPWGFGKWWGRRGRSVQSMVSSCEPTALFLGDSGGRLAWQGMPKLMRWAQRRGFRVLPGTDPLPIGGDHRRVGGFGFVARATLPESAPWRALRDWLVMQAASPSGYGRACGPLRFTSNQLRLRLRGRQAAAGRSRDD